MKKFGETVNAALDKIPGMDAGAIRKAARVKQVRDMWAELVEPAILAHTNGVYVFKDKDGKRKMHVYVDESIYAAELKNRGELLKLMLAEQFGERIDEFSVSISRGERKHEHPYAQTKKAEIDARPAVPLSQAELQSVEDSVSQIPDKRLREHFKEAMIRDLEWKKGNRPNPTAES
jgi:hypothetical protein